MKVAAYFTAKHHNLPTIRPTPKENAKCSTSAKTGPKTGRSGLWRWSKAEKAEKSKKAGVAAFRGGDGGTGKAKRGVCRFCWRSRPEWQKCGGAGGETEEKFAGTAFGAGEVNWWSSKEGQG